MVDDATAAKGVAVLNAYGPPPPLPERWNEPLPGWAAPPPPQTQAEWAAPPPALGKRDADAAGLDAHTSGVPRARQ